MSYLVARASGANNSNVSFQQLGATSSETVQPARTKFTGIVDANGLPIHRQTQARQKMGFHQA
jgi:hypothetical protein